MAVELILRKDVPKLGRLGDVVKVAPGYARNYLLPRGLAMRVSADNVQRLAKEKEKADKLREIEKAEARGLAEKISSASATVAVKANEEGHLYGSVDARMVAEAFQREGFPVDPKAVELEENIKELGVYPLRITLVEDVTAETKVWVVEEKDEKDGADAAPGTE